MKQNACRAVLMGHARDVETTHGMDPTWKGLHVDAWNHPRTNGEIAVKQALQGFAAMADGYTEDLSDDDGGLGRDGYFGEHAADMLKAIHAWLSMGVKSRLDSGAISRLIGQLARASGVDPDQV